MFISTGNNKHQETFSTHLEPENLCCVSFVFFLPSPLTSSSSAACFFCLVIELYFIPSKSHIGHIGFDVRIQLQKDIIGDGTNPDSHWWDLVAFYSEIVLHMCDQVTGMLIAMKTSHDGSFKHTTHRSVFTLTLTTQLFGLLHLLQRIPLTR